MSRTSRVSTQCCTRSIHVYIGVYAYLSSEHTTFSRYITTLLPFPKSTLGANVIYCNHRPHFPANAWRPRPRRDVNVYTPRCYTATQLDTSSFSHTTTQTRSILYPKTSGTRLQCFPAQLYQLIIVQFNAIRLAVIVCKT